MCMIRMSSFECVFVLLVGLVFCFCLFRQVFVFMSVDICITLCIFVSVPTDSYLYPAVYVHRYICKFVSIYSMYLNLAVFLYVKLYTYLYLYGCFCSCLCLCLCSYS